MSDTVTRYSPGEIEKKWYSHWMEKNYFHSEPDDREPFTIVIPPPNVTGILHMGHILNNTIQDVLIRKARMEGKNACWVPGMDHASIATEAKVVRLLREKGIKKSDLTREEFLEHAWAWKEKYGGIILKQLQILGASCDWERTAFTMDDTRTEAVYTSFIDLYKKGHLYRNLRMINWDPEAQTVLSNEEVIYHEENANLYHVNYHVVDKNGIEQGSYLTIATTRPETILGDTAVSVHPNDKRYSHLKGQFVKVPMVDRIVPIIFDDYVDIEFGTGALKITPAHDQNDYEIGKRHNLETIDILNDDGTISDAGQLFVGLDRDEARIQAKIKLKELDLLVKIEQITHNVGRSERTNAIVEPKLSLQWFVEMKALSDPALKAVMEDKVQFFPEKFKNTYRHWMENIRDWCISRQLWWGQRIPAWYLKDENGEHVFVAANENDALQQAKEKLGDHLTLRDLKQDEDVLDTWFSSWLWPISVFDGFKSQKEVDYYYPTDVLVTGWDIIFLWVARMIMAGYEWRDEKPFKSVYFTGMVRDKQRRKMSKSLGNSPDALKLIEEYGADGVRFGILYSSPVGGDLLFDDSHVEQGRKFCNKIWNALNLIKSWEIVDDEQSEQDHLACEWFEQLSQQIILDVNEKIDQFRLSEALVLLYKYVWGDFCSHYLEMIKAPYSKPINATTYRKTTDFFTRICSLLHPFMPFITEELWHSLKERETGDDCIISVYPQAHKGFSSDLISEVELLLDVKTKILEIRNDHKISFTESIEFGLVKNEEVSVWNLAGAKSLLKKLTNIESFVESDQAPEQSLTFISDKATYYVVSDIEVDIAAEIIKLKEELDYQTGFIEKVNKKLANERFIQNAPEAVVAIEKKKQSDSQTRIDELQKRLKEIG